MGFEEVSNKVDFVALENDILEFWRDTDAFNELRRLRAQTERSLRHLQLSGRPGDGQQSRWACITAGDAPTKTSTNVTRPCWARTSAGKTALTARVCGSKSRSKKSLASPTSATSRSLGWPSLCACAKRGCLKFAAIQTEQSQRLGYWMDWNDTDELRRLSELMVDDAAAGNRWDGRGWAGHRHVSNRSSRGWACRNRRLLFHLQRREQLPNLGLPASSVHENGWLYKGRDVMPWCARCGTGISQHEIVTDGYHDVTHDCVFVRFPLTQRTAGRWRRR